MHSDIRPDIKSGVRPDLHCHSNASDGSLTPVELISAAIDAGVTTLAITDHDTVSGWRKASEQVPDSLSLIPGIEFSTVWNGIGIHIVGLNIDPDSDAMTEGTRTQEQARMERAGKIVERLNKRGMSIDLDDILKENKQAVPGRVHIANHLVRKKYVKDLPEAFKKHLGAGKPGDVKNLWASLETVTGWITDSGGIAVLAHPLKYSMTFTKLNRFLDDFVDAGGTGIEVISGAQDKDATLRLGRLCRDRNLLASCGSDFHHPGQNWAVLGKFPELPAGCRPVWEQWR